MAGQNKKVGWGVAHHRGCRPVAGFNAAGYSKVTGAGLASGFQGIQMWIVLSGQSPAPPGGWPRTWCSFWCAPTGAVPPLALCANECTPKKSAVRCAHGAKPNTTLRVVADMMRLLVCPHWRCAPMSAPQKKALFAALMGQSPTPPCGWWRTWCSFWCAPTGAARQ